MHNVLASADHHHDITGRHSSRHLALLQDPVYPRE